MEKLPEKILDDLEFHGHGCINESFRLLKDNEIRKYGQCPTKRLVMDTRYRF